MSRLRNSLGAGASVAAILYAQVIIYGLLVENFLAIYLWSLPAYLGMGILFSVVRFWRNTQDVERGKRSQGFVGVQLQCWRFADLDGVPFVRYLIQ